VVEALSIVAEAVVVTIPAVVTDEAGLLPLLISS
jgi:UPF0716 family protein affecting phage T7 exclusion